MNLSMGRLSGNLSDADKKALMDEGQCFYCKEKGHRTNKCPRKPQTQQRSRDQQPICPSQNRIAETTDKEDKGLQQNVHDLQMQLQAMTTEDRRELLDSLMRDNLDF